MKKFNLIILSKDRACQVDLLLRSIKKYFYNYKSQSVSVLYQATNNKFYNSFKILSSSYPNILIQEQKGNLKEQLLNIIDPFSSYSLFLRDIYLFRSSFSLEELKDNPYLSIRIRKQKRNVRYPIELNGQVFKTKEIGRTILLSDFSTFEELEDCIKNDMPDCEVLCSEIPKIIPLSDEEGLGPDYLNDMYLTGKRIAMKDIGLEATAGQMDFSLYKK
jgi:hypothetical protein